LQDPDFHESVKKNISTAAETVQKTGFAGYQAIGKQVSTHTGVQLPGATSSTSTGSLGGSPSLGRKEDDYDDFWAENGIKEESSSKKGMFVGQTQGTTGSTGPKSGGTGKEDEWENW
jgi:hypothetical protein